MLHIARRYKIYIIYILYSYLRECEALGLHTLSLEAGLVLVTLGNVPRGGGREEGGGGADELPSLPAPPQRVIYFKPSLRRSDCSFGGFAYCQEFLRSNFSKIFIQPSFRFCCCCCFCLLLFFLGGGVLDSLQTWSRGWCVSRTVTWIRLIVWWTSLGRWVMQLYMIHVINVLLMVNSSWEIFLIIL